MAESKKQSIEKVPQVGFTLSLKSANQAEYPLVYQSDAWDVVESNSKLKDVLGDSGQFDQHTINEAVGDALGQLTLHRRGKDGASELGDWEINADFVGNKLGISITWDSNESR